MLAVHAEPFDSGHEFLSSAQQETLESFKQRDDGLIPAPRWITDRKATKEDVKNQLCTASDQARSLKTTWFRVKKHSDEK